MNCCVHCEIERAKNAVKIMMYVGDSREKIASALTHRFNIAYYLVDNTLYRNNTTPPHTPYVVWIFEG